MFNVYKITEANKELVASNVLSVGDAVLAFIGKVAFMEQNGDSFDVINTNNDQFAIEPVKGNN